MAIKAPRIAMYDTWNGGNMDEGWTRWVLEQYGFRSTRLHNAEIKAGGSHEKYDAIILPDQSLELDPRREHRDARPGRNIAVASATTGVAALKDFVDAGGTLITLGAASRSGDREVPGAGAQSEERSDARSAFRARARSCASRSIRGTRSATEWPRRRYGFYMNSPFFSVVEGFASQRATVVARYPNTDVLASGWLRGENLMAGRAAVVSIDMNPGRIVLFGLRPQHRAQTHATFPMLFNALYLSTTANAGCGGACAPSARREAGGFRLQPEGCGCRLMSCAPAGPARLPRGGKQSRARAECLLESSEVATEGHCSHQGLRRRSYGHGDPPGDSPFPALR